MAHVKLDLLSSHTMFVFFFETLQLAWMHNVSIRVQIFYLLRLGWPPPKSVTESRFKDWY